MHALLDGFRYLTETMFGKLKGDRDAFAKTSAVPVLASILLEILTVLLTHIQKLQEIFYYVNY